MAKGSRTATRLLLSGVVICVGIQGVQSETAYIYGKSGWFSGGDIVQFTGDSGYTTLYEPHCAMWDDVCFVDRGLGFRKVYGVDDENCTFEAASDTCCACAAVCCYWGGDCEGHIGDVCNTELQDCWETEEECSSNCYCQSLWEVVGFNVAPGYEQEGPGCYVLDLICDPGDEDCLPISGLCDTILLWWLP